MRHLDMQHLSIRVRSGKGKIYRWGRVWVTVKLVVRVECGVRFVLVKSHAQRSVLNMLRALISGYRFSPICLRVAKLSMWLLNLRVKNSGTNTSI